MNLNTLEYFVYQIPLGIIAPIKYDIKTTENSPNGKLPLSGMCLRDYQNPTKFLFWDAEGNYICTTGFSEVKSWSKGFPSKVQATLTYPCKKQRNE